MDVRARIDEILKRMPKPKFRASHGQWVKPAWVVRGLVEAGQPVTAAVRFVVREMCLTPPDLAERSVRQAYYDIRLKPWRDKEAEALQAAETHREKCAEHKRKTRAESREAREDALKDFEP